MRVRRGARGKISRMFRGRLVGAEHVASGASGVASCCDSRRSRFDPGSLEPGRQVYTLLPGTSSAIGPGAGLPPPSSKGIPGPFPDSRVPLLGRDGSAIMRRDGTIRPRGAFAPVVSGGILLLFLVTAPPTGSAAALDDGSRAGAETTAVWLPAQAEEMESPERLAEPPLTGAAAVRGDFSDGRFQAARFTTTIRGTSASATAAWIGTRAGEKRQTAFVYGSSGRVRVAAGHIVVRDAPVLFGEASGLSRRLRRPLEPRTSAPEWDAPRGATGQGLDGASFGLSSSLASGSRTRSWDLWALGGRIPGDGNRLAAAGLARQAARWAVAASLAWRETEGVRASPGDSASHADRRFGSVAARWRGGASSLSVEALLSPEFGPTLLASAAVEDARSPIRFESRWRRRAGERKPIASELTAELAVGGAGVARLAWRPWSAAAFADDGVLELDGRFRPAGWPGTVRMRVGRRGGEGSLASAAVEGEAARAVPERYVVFDVPLAGERGRLVSVLGSRRERGWASARAVGTSAGARARVAWRGRAGLTAQIEAARTHGTAASGTGAAWSSAPTPSGEEALTSRRTSGVYATVGGWVRLGTLVLRVHAQDGESDRGGRPLTATVLMEWSGSAIRNGAPGDAGSGG